MKIKVKYIEPADYIPKELRKLYKLGEYAEQNQGQQPGPATTQSREGTAKQDQAKGSEEP